MTARRIGGCLCGAVKLSGTPGVSVGACHCHMCRRWGGGPLMTVESRDVQFEGEEHIAVYASSEWAERAFCKRCGSHLYWRFRRDGPHELPVGLFAGNDGPWVFATQVFIDEKPAFYAFANDTKKLTAAESFAQYPSGG